MQLRSIHVGKIQTHEHKGQTWQSAYKKARVDGTIYVGKLTVDGDEQFHTKFHGGEYRAVLMYAASNYDVWRNELGYDLPDGSFAENFTVTNLTEDTVCIGDIYQIGDIVRVQVAQPRQPCNQIYKALGIRGIVNKIKATHRSGWYCRVLQEGEVEAGMAVALEQRLHPEWTISYAHQAMENRKDDPDTAHLLSKIEALEPGWRKKLAQA